MRMLILVGLAILGCTLPNAARADSLTVDQLIEMCSGNEKDIEARIRDAMQQHAEMRSMSAQGLAELRQRERHEALLACEMYLVGSLDQIIFFFDKDGLFEDAKAICIPRSYYERPSALRELLSYKLVNMPKKERASFKSNTAKFWIATTMLQLFGCAEAPSPQPK